MQRLRELTPNLGTKLLAVLLAYGVWLAVIEEKQALRQLEVPVRFENLDSELAMSRDRVTSILVRVQAAEGVIKEIEPPDIEVSVDLARLGVGSHSLTLRPDSPSVMPRRIGVRVVEIIPAVLQVHLERRVQAQIPVRPVVAGTPAEGFEVTGVTVTPPSVTIGGPESAVQATTTALTRPVGVEGRRAPYEQDAWVDVDSPDVTILSRTRVRIAVHISEKTAERTFKDLAVRVLNTPFETRVDPARINLTARGPERIIAQLRSEDFAPWIDASGLKPQRENYNLDVQVKFARSQLADRLELKLSEARAQLHVLDRRVPRDRDG